MFQQVYWFVALIHFAQKFWQCQNQKFWGSCHHRVGCYLLLDLHEPCLILNGCASNQVLAQSP